MHAGSEMFHVFHLHGGGIRWRFNPVADQTFDYAETGLDKSPKTQCRPRRASTPRPPARASATTSRSRAAPAACSRPRATSSSTATSPRTTSPACGPSGASTTRYQPDLAAAARPRRRCRARSTSAGLIGARCPTARRSRQPTSTPGSARSCPPQGVTQNNEDASVWNWTVDNTDPAAPVTSASPRTRAPGRTDNYTVPGHPTAYPGDVFKTLPGETGPRPVILFDPLNGRSRSRCCVPTSASDHRSPERPLRCALARRDRRPAIGHRADRRGRAAPTASARRAPPSATSTSCRSTACGCS